MNNKKDIKIKVGSILVRPFFNAILKRNIINYGWAIVGIVTKDSTYDDYSAIEIYWIYPPYNNQKKYYSSIEWTFLSEVITYIHGGTFKLI